MIKYGGPGTLKQACERRQCLNPQMPGVAPLFPSPQYSPKESTGNGYLLKNGVYIKEKMDFTIPGDETEIKHQKN